MTKEKGSRTMQLTVAKITELELDNLRSFLTKLGDLVKENDHYAIDDEQVNEEIAQFIRESFPSREAFIGPLNLGILLDNYQDKESDILAHAKWIVEMFKLFAELDEYLSSNPKNYIGSGSILHQKIKKYTDSDSTT